MKREAQVFEWSAKNGVLSIVGRKDGPMASTVLTFDSNAYPANIRQNIADAGLKAVFQQRSSQVETDDLKVAYWMQLDELFASGEWEFEGSGKGAPVVGAWVEVLAKNKNVDVGALQAKLNSLDKDSRAKIRKSVEEKYAKEIEAHKAERKLVEVSLDTI